ncbi:type IV secretory system conjugative DNA transfer family protein [Curtobacterium sp. MCBD17_019]|nr:type IV secretory system conjugative DNA transfer family protein [Curtobacterium sp. MCBD17_019]
MRTLLAGLARAGRGERVILQFTVGARTRRTVPVGRGPRDRLEVEKAREPRFATDLRVAAVAGSPDRVRSLVNGVLTGLRLLEVPEVRFGVHRSSPEAFAAVRLPWFWRSQLSPRELVPLTAWPIAERLPGVPSPHPVILAATAEIARRGLVLGLETAAESERPIALRFEDALRHLHVLGPTGVGKSTLLARLALQDMEADRGLCLIDPKGDLVETLLARIPTERRDDVVVLDPRDPAPVGLASLQGDPDRTADVLLATFHSLYEDAWGPRSHDIIHAGVLTLARRGDASLVLLPTLLTNPGFRRSVTSQVVKDDPLGLGSFWGWYEALSDGERQHAIAPVMNKLRPILLRPGMRHTLGQRHPRFELADVFTKRRILLVSLAKGQLGPEAAQLLGSLVVSLLWDTITARGEQRSHASLYIDEVQDYLRLADIGDALAQARGFGVGLTLAHQHLGQLPKPMRDAVLANARSRVMFGVESGDARDLARMSRGHVEAIDLESLPAHHAYAALLSRGTPAPWVSLTTTPLMPPTTDPAAVRDRSRERYGVPASDTDSELGGFIDPPKTRSERIGRTPKQPGGAS